LTPERDGTFWIPAPIQEKQQRQQGAPRHQYFQQEVGTRLGPDFPQYAQPADDDLHVSLLLAIEWARNSLGFIN
jgi:hypothetical protein